MSTRPTTRSVAAKSPQSTDASTSAAVVPSTAPPKSQKQMTKAERRELQEAQRAAKEQGKGKPGPAPKGPKATPAQAQTAQTQKQSAPGPSGGGARSSAPAETATQGQTYRQGKTNQPNDTRSIDQQSQDGPSRGARIFSHFGSTKHASTVKGDIHPAIISVGSKFGSFAITGANARCVHMLLAFKSVIRDYIVPPNTVLSRHLSTHLSHQINYLVSLRPLSVTMGNAIRWLKVEISNSNLDLPEQEAKDELCQKIDTFIRDRITLADKVIQENALSKIRDGDVILVYSRSTVVENVLLHAHEEGTSFSVVVVDSRPMLEAKKLLLNLTAAGIQCTYLLLPALGSVIDQTTKVFLGAHSMHANGAILSRAGTALVAMMASQRQKPVLVCSQTYKFSESVPLDGFARNELVSQSILDNAVPSSADPEPTLPIPTLQVMNPLYDLTPPQHITAIVTEAGIVPPSSISSLPFALGRLAL